MKPSTTSYNPPDRYEQTFSRLKKANRPAFCPFAVLGHPTEEESLERIKLYLKSNPDVLELGIPFSDPVADGPIIQMADELAIQNAMTPKKCMTLIQKTRAITNIPIADSRSSKPSSQKQSDRPLQCYGEIAPSIDANDGRPSEC